MSLTSAIHARCELSQPARDVEVWAVGVTRRRVAHNRRRRGATAVMSIFFFALCKHFNPSC